MFTEQPPSPLPATDETARKPARRRKTAGEAKRSPPKKRSQTKTPRRPATPPTVDAQPVSMPADLSAEALAKVENHEQHDAAEREAARQDAERQEEQARHTEALAKAAAHMQALARHRRAMDAVDERERKALREFDTRRRTWPGVVIAIVRGRQHFDTQRRDITDRHEAERMTLRRAFTAPRTRED